MRVLNSGRTIGFSLLTALAACSGGDGDKNDSPTQPSTAATQLAFTTMPANSNPGRAITAVVTARSASGATATGFNGSVTVALGQNSGGSVLSGTTTVAASAGVATFSNLSLDKVGTSYTLVATSQGLTSATSSGFTITTTASQLAFTTAPSSVVAGGTISTVVTARNASGTTATDFNGNVTIAIGQNPGGSVLSGTTTVAAVSGVATFSNLSLDKVGTPYTLVATSSGLTSATSSVFSITTPPQTGGTKLYISPILNFALKTTATARSSGAVEWCVSNTEWIATLAGDMVGNPPLQISLGMKTATGSSGTGSLQAQIIWRRAAGGDFILAQHTFTVSSTYTVQTYTTSVAEQTTTAGDKIVLKTSTVAGSAATPCVAEFVGPGTDNFIVVPTVSISP